MFYFYVYLITFDLAHMSNMFSNLSFIKFSAMCPQASRENSGKDSKDGNSVAEGFMGGEAPNSMLKNW